MIFVAPTRSKPPRPAVYKEVVREESDLISVECKVRVYVTFKETCRMRELPTSLTFQCNDGYIQSPTTIMYDRIPSDKYAFLVIVKLSAEAYETHRDDLENYVFERARQSYDYANNLRYCIDRYGGGREYEVEEYLPIHEPDGLIFRYDRHERRLYVPVR